MNNNFKKVISTVAALAMASSSFVAMAATYPDIEGSSYASAIEQLSALGIVDGFDDGTFKPEEKVTRAQMAKLVVGAKNLLASAESNTTVKFDDVAPGTASEWAIGYVAEAVAQQIVNGTSATTFDPTASVTYAQAVKMLVNACGYEDYAQTAGGWPSGYLTYGNELGINKGISGVGNDTELNRGQVAQMIANAVKAPILEVDKYEVDNGQKYPVYVKRDGEEGRSFKSLLTKEWDVYEVYGRVESTSRNGANDPGEVNYAIEKSDNYDDQKIGPNESVTGDVANNAKVGNTNAEELLLEYTYALIELNDDDEATIVYIESAGKNQTVSFDDDLYAGFVLDEDGEVETDKDGNMKLELYKSATSSNTTTYKIDKDAKLLVNGVEYTKGFVAGCEAYLENASYTNAVLTDTPTAGNASTDGYYDYISVDSYGTAIVSEVTTKSGGIQRINFESYAGGIDKAYLEIDPEDDETDVSVTDKSGADVDVAALAENDVLSIAYNVTQSFDSSSFYKIIVSKDTAEGRMNGTVPDDDDTLYTIGDTQYKWVHEDLADNLTTGTSYKVYLDKDGNIAKREVLAVSVNYAIVDRFFTSAGDNKVRLILKDGTKADYTLKADGDKTTAKLSDVMEVNTTYTLLDEDGNLIETTANGKIATLDRFVDYSVNSSGEVTLKDLANTENDVKLVATSASDVYKASSGRIGSYGVADTSVILDASAYAVDTTESVAVTSKDILIDEMDYLAVFAGQKNSSDNTYPFVVLLTGNFGYTVNSRMVVAAGNVSSISEDGVDKKAIPVYEGTGADAQLVNLVTEDDTVDTTGIVEGTPFIYSTNSEGEVDSVVTLLNTVTEDKDGKEVVTPVVLDNSTTADELFAICGPIETGVTFKGEDDDKVEFYLYPVVKKYASSVELATDFDYEKMVSADTGKSYSYDADAQVRTFDGSLRAKNYVSFGTGSAVVGSTISKNGKVEGDDTKIDWTSDNNVAAFALVRVYEDDVQEIYSISLND